MFEELLFDVGPEFFQNLCEPAEAALLQQFPDRPSRTYSSGGLGSATLFMTIGILMSTTRPLSFCCHLDIASLPPNQRFVACLDVGEKRS